MLSEQHISGQFEALLADERARLVRLCTRLAGNGDAAEDLAQETLFEAWRHRHKLVDYQGASAWLSAIARNVCLRWRRRYAREQGRRVGLAADAEQSLLDALPDPVDLELELEREELAALLDHAMDLLPPQTRSALVEHYLQAVPIVDVATHQRVREGTVAVRIHRGKLALRQALAGELRDDAVSYGLTLPELERWRTSRMWCPLCGQELLRSHLEGGGEHFEIKCPRCWRQPGGMDIRWPASTLFDGITSHHIAYRRLCDWSYSYFQAATARAVAPCIQCGVPVNVRKGVPPTAPAYHQGIHAVHMRCPSCNWGRYSSLNGLVIQHPAARAFWRAHPRIRVIPPREVEVDGRAVLVTGVTSLDGSASVNLLAVRDTLEIVAVHGAADADGS